MRARIRTVKPEFFKHEDLFETEVQTGLPIRLAYIGLWTQADREGRFEWRPRILKTDIMPYDEVDFSRVLDALASRGLVVRYAVQGKAYGFIPSWNRHQVINNRESGSLLPPPPETIEEFDASGTREPRVTNLHVHAPVELELELELEQNEPKGSSLSEPSVADQPKSVRTKKDYPDDFEAAWLAYPNRSGMSKAEALPQWKKLSVEDRAKVLPSIPGYIAHLKTKPDLETIHFCRYLSKRRFEAFAQAVAVESDNVWRTRLGWARGKGQWPVHQWGPMPGKPDCRAPAELLAEGDGVGWAIARAA